jgi:hypothetical protein
VTRAVATFADLAGTAPPWVHRWVAAGAALPPGLLAAPPGFVVRTLDGARCGTKAALLRELARALAFPATWGENWDALDECLTDLAWLPAPGYRLVVTDAHRLLDGAGSNRVQEWRTFTRLLRDVGHEWAGPQSRPRAGTPFHTVLVSSNHEALPVRLARLVP